MATNQSKNRQSYSEIVAEQNAQMLPSERAMTAMATTKSEQGNALTDSKVEPISPEQMFLELRSTINHVIVAQREIRQAQKHNPDVCKTILVDVGHDIENILDTLLQREHTMFDEVFSVEE